MKKTLTLFAGLVMISTATHAQWNNIAPDGSDFMKVEFPSTLTGYVIKSNGSVMGMAKTINAGTSWTNISFNPILRVHDLQFMDDNNGFVTADSIGSTSPYSLLVYKTIDGGANWSLLHHFPAAVPFNSKVYFHDALHGVVTETYGKIWYTANGGASWTMTDVESYYPQFIEFSSPSVGYITCADGTFSYYGVVLKTIDGGATWNTVFDFSTIPLVYTSAGAVDFLDDNTGYMQTMDNFYKTTDGGVTWDSLPFAQNNGLYFQDIVFYSVMGGFGCDSQGGIYRTTDGGTTWVVERPMDTVTWLRSMDIAGTTAYAAGSGGKLLQSLGAISGVQEMLPAEKMNVYPNPSSTGRFQLENKDGRALNIKVYQLTGELLLTKEMYTGLTLDLSMLSNGLYLLEYGGVGEMAVSQKISVAR